MLLKFVCAGAIALTSIPAISQGIPREANGFPVVITKPIDGDTFEVDARAWSPFPNLTWRVRIRGIDTPEKRSKCEPEKAAAKRAQEYAGAVLKRYDNKVWLQAVQHDKYGGRFDAVIILPNGKSLGDVMIAAGLARPYLGGARRPWCVFGQYRP